MFGTFLGKNAQGIFVWVFFLIGFLSIPQPSSASVKAMLPDFYSEPGLSPFRDGVSANVNEVVDTFSGALHLSHVDLVVPGNGGFDIKIQRSYNSNNVYHSRKTPLNLAPNLTTLLPRGPVGMGWTLHMGRVLKSQDLSTGLPFGICLDGGLNDDTLNNAILELPDGSQQILFVNATSFSAAFITKEQWVANCVTGGLQVISPNGVKYTMTKLVSGGFTYTSNSLDYAWYPTRIEDRNGNYLIIDYLAIASNKNALIDRVTASDGRVVDFSYTYGTDPTNVLLTSISANGQTWQYQYTADTGGAGYYQLTRVLRPDGLDWNYQYHAKGTGQAGNKILQRITYPYGATVTYEYGYVCFMAVTCSSVYDTFYSLVVTSKVNGGRDVAPGTWMYSYSPSTVEDVTTVSFPGGSYIYKHYGSRMFIGGATTPGKTIWRTGLLKEKLTYDGASLINREIYTWDAPYLLSNEQYVRPPYDGSDANHPRYADYAVFAPVLLRKDVVRDGTAYTTTYSNFDASYNPRTIGETGQAIRTTSLSYFPRVAGQNIVRLVKDEVLTGETTGKNIYRTFDGTGNLTQTIRHGVQENYSYWPTGDLYTKTNARAQIWTYNSYYRGIPQQENHPAGIIISRNVNATGTIARETNGRGYATSYTYNGMNRPTSITRPAGTAISISWGSTGRTVTRGSYSQITTFDGFGRPSNIDTAGVTKNINYNALGFKSFESYLSSTAGDSFGTDVLGRVTGIAHADGTYRTIQHSPGNVVRITNERNYVTNYSYRSFGDPDKSGERVLMRIDAPEGVSTVFTRNVLGQPLSVTQGGVTRQYSYNSSNFLTAATNPETGDTVYGRDAVGNMTSRAVGTSGTTTYTFDGLNRLTNINYPASPDVVQQYDDNNNVTLIDNGIARRTFGYDANDNLRTESVVVGGQTLSAAYAYNSLDNLSSITYPSLRQVAYSPDVLGRPTAAVPYLTSVSHHPNGVPQSIQYANGQVATIGINNRQWISGISAQKAGAGYAAGLTYGYDGLANVTSITNSLDSMDSKSMTYDGLDRLIGAGSAAISYDGADNITYMRTDAGTLGYSYINNRLSNVSGYKTYSFGYDSYGNVRNNGLNTFVYDDASNLRSVGGATTASYDYDGKNMRVHTLKNGQDTYFFYANNGNLLGEYDASGVWMKEYAYLGSKLVATVANVPVTPAPTVSLSASPTTVVTGGSSTLTWSSTNATSCTASGAWAGAKALSGSESTGVLTVTSTFTLACTGAGGTASQSVTVTVTATPAPTVSLSASPLSVVTGGSSTLTWSSINATSCNASGAWTGAKALSGSESTGVLTVTSTFTLSCTGTGGTASQSVTVTVTATPAPTVSLSASPTSVVTGGSSTLTWSSINATSCTASGAWTGTKALSGSESTGVLTVTSTFTLSCIGAGGTAAKSVTVTVTPAATYAISGRAVEAVGSGFAGLPGVTINLTGAATASTTTDGSGNYSFSALANGGYSVTPSKSGYNFSPASRNVTVSGASVTGQNFTGSPGGPVNNPPNTPASPSPANGATGVSTTPTLSWTGGDPDAGNTVTYDVYFGTAASPPLVVSNNATTSYVPGALVAGTLYYWRIVARDNLGATTNGPTWNFITAGSGGGGSFSISGRITEALGSSFVGVSGITIGLTGAATASTVTDGNGNYSFAGLVNGAYTITPNSSGYRFSPINRAVTVSGVNVTGQDFTGVAVAHPLASAHFSVSPVSLNDTIDLSLTLLATLDWRRPGF